MSKKTCIIAYDISNEKLLRKTAKYLEQQGVRLQKSVFAVEKDSYQLKQIQEKLNKLLGDEHSVIYIPLCSS